MNSWSVRVTGGPGRVDPRFVGVTDGPGRMTLRFVRVTDGEQ